MCKSLVIGCAVVLGSCAAPTAEQRISAEPARVQVATADDAAAGRQMALQKCSTCHAVERGGQSPVPDAPSFASIAKKYADASLTVLVTEGIATGHPSMPRWMFTASEAKDLLAYMRSLRTEKAG